MRRKKAKKAVRRRKNIPRPYNGGEWTVARFNSFIASALRGARWPAKYACIKDAFVKVGINPKTGHKCKLHRCPECKELFPQKDMQADHIIPVVGVEGFTTWDDFIKRLYCEADGFRALCKGCHKEVTAKEKAERAAYKKKQAHDDLFE